MENMNELAQNIKERVTCVDLYNQHSPDGKSLPIKGGQGWCIFHNDKKQNGKGGQKGLSVKPDIFKCFSPGCPGETGGDVIEMYRLIHHINTSGEAIVKLAEELGLIDNKDDKPNGNISTSCNGLDDKALDYLKSRGLNNSIEYLINNNLVCSGKDYVGFIVEDIDGKTGNQKRYYRNGYRYEKNSKSNLFFINKGNGNQTIITESVIDALSVYEIMGDEIEIISLGSANNVNMLSELDIKSPILFFDNDRAGQEATKKAASIIDCRAVNWRLCQDRKIKDVNDLLRAGLGNTIKEMIETADVKYIFGNGLNASEIMDYECQEIHFIVDTIVSEGTNLLIGKSKVGKSWLSLHMAIQIARGKKALDTFDVKHSGVLFLALEDNIRRLKKRLNILTKGVNLPDNLYFETAWPRLDNGGEDYLKTYLRLNNHIKLVVIDTLGWIKGDCKKKSLYDVDLATIEPFKRIYNEMGVSFLLIHHMRKADTDDDILDLVNGGMGLTASVDTNILLRKKRKEEESFLSIIPRDGEEKEYILKFDSGRWIYQGEADQYRASKSQREILDVLDKPMKPKEIADILGTTQNAIRLRLHRMEGLVYKNTRGEYSRSDEMMK